MNYNIGETIKIITMYGEPSYTNRTGTITHIDDAGQLHGTWGGLAIIPGFDDFKTLSEAQNTPKNGF